MRTVIVAAERDHNGNASLLRTAQVEWLCPHCDGPRGMPVLEKPMCLSLPKYKRTPRHVWQNPCRHHDPLGQHRSAGVDEGVLP